MRTHAGIASEAFKALAENDVNIQMISTSEIKITIVINEVNTDKAVKCLHETFNLDK
jgi:aspartate kinase